MPRISDVELDELVRKETAHLLIFNGPLMLWDLDSTVCNTAHRHHMAEAIRAGEDVTWDDYSMLCKDDEVIEGSVALMRALDAYGHVAVSARSSCATRLTKYWFTQNGVPFSAAILRPDGDHTPNGEWKVRVIKALRRLGADIRLFFEDWDEAAAVIRSETSIPVVGINPFYPRVKVQENLQ